MFSRKYRSKSMISSNLSPTGLRSVREGSRGSKGQKISQQERHVYPHSHTPQNGSHWRCVRLLLRRRDPNKESRWHRQELQMPNRDQTRLRVPRAVDVPSRLDFLLWSCLCVLVPQTFLPRACEKQHSNPRLKDTLRAAELQTTERAHVTRQYKHMIAPNKSPTDILPAPCIGDAEVRRLQRHHCLEASSQAKRAHMAGSSRRW